MGTSGWDWVVPDGLWDIVRPLLPPERLRPQGGGTRNIDDEAVFAAIVYVLTTGCAWRHLPPCFGASKSTVHRRFTIWSDAGLWGRLHRRLRELLSDSGLVDLSRVLVDTAHVRAKKGADSRVRAPSTAANPVPSCTSCPTAPGCRSSSGSPRPTVMTATA
ncbi:hypothetical protein GCM10023205_70960 [Yinghuangia aomiensis]|uniref:Insertion element IS402-like domain-containing protein n=1 Tax=Yinghuangia aomiensis TaxID=676205 RepID=A0ABP9I7K9_9ACTN